MYNGQLEVYNRRIVFRHGPFDILGGGAWDILEKNFLALILA